MTFWKRKRPRHDSDETPTIRSRIAIYGGTFDPIHNAHLTVAREASMQFGLSTVLFVVAANPPHKAGAVVADYENRYRMVELACQGELGFTPSRIEEDEGISYSIDTIEKVKALSGAEAQVYFLIGADAFAQIQGWHRWGDVVRQADFIVVTRPGHHYRTPPGCTVHRLDTLAMPVSSSDIRVSLAKGEDPPELPLAVLEHIRFLGLYSYPLDKP